MTNPVIIFGAGASYDYSPIKKGSPLTDELIDTKYLNTTISSKYFDVEDLFSTITLKVKLGESFEECLSKIMKEEGSNVHIKEQIVALRFYLKEFFEEVSTNFIQNNNNYKALISKIRSFSKGQACIVTLNYDTLFEKSVNYIDWSNLNSYIKGDLKLIKLHGSHDWAYIRRKSDSKLEFFNITTAFDYLKRYPDHLDKLHEQNIYPYHIKELVKRECLQLPAIALPLPEKQHFICPNTHIEALKKAIIETDRILVIGWSASDPHLLELIKDNASQSVLILVVSRNKNSAGKVLEKFIELKGKTFFNTKSFNGNFSSFVISDDCVNFLKNNLLKKQ